jgi:hypothetical protein
MQVELNVHIFDTGSALVFKPFIRNADQGCQIFLGTTYQNRGKYTKGPQNILREKWSKSLKNGQNH